MNRSKKQKKKRRNNMCGSCAIKQYEKEKKKNPAIVKIALNNQVEYMVIKTLGNTFSTAQHFVYEKYCPLCGIRIQ